MNDDSPTFVSDGACEFGIVGGNVLEEFALGTEERGFEILAKLGFGRCSLRIAAPEGVEYRGPESLAGARIATSYPRLLRRFLDDKGVEAEITMPREFVVPGETRFSAALEVARTVVRRAERRAVALDRQGSIPEGHLLPYLNRLADLL